MKLVCVLTLHAPLTLDTHTLLTPPSPTSPSPTSLLRYLDGECGGYNQNAWQCIYNFKGPNGSWIMDPKWSQAQKDLFHGGETAMWGEGINQVRVWSLTVGSILKDVLMCKWCFVDLSILDYGQAKCSDIISILE